MSNAEQASPYPGYVLVPVPRARPNKRVGTVGAIITVVGALVVLAATVLDWYSASGVHVNLQDIANGTSVAGAKDLPHAYFGWVLWVLFALTLVAALLATLPGPLSVTLRILSPVLGVLNALLMVVSLGQLQEASIYDHAVVGFWAILIGFMLTGLGGAFGPRRR